MVPAHFTTERFPAFLIALIDGYDGYSKAGGTESFIMPGKELNILTAVLFK